MDLGDAKQVKKEKRRLKNRKTIEGTELSRVLAQREVRNFIWTVLEECGIYDLSGESLHDLAVSKGRRSVGHAIIAMIDNAVPHMYMKIYTENRKDEKKDG